VSAACQTITERSAGRRVVSIGNAGYDRVDRDHYPTPRENVTALVIGLQRAGIEPSSNRVLDPCGGEGAITHALNPFGFDVRLTDLYPAEYRAAQEFYATTEPLDARNISDLRRGGALTRARAIVTNPPYSVSTHAAIVSACLALLQEGEIELLALLHLSNHLTTGGGPMSTMLEPRFTIRIDCCWRTILFGGPGATTGKLTHSWRVWTREPRRKAFSPYPCIGITLAEAKAKITRTNGAR
jgi:hypothetical protein